MAGELRQPLITGDILSDGESSLRMSFMSAAALSEGYPNLRQSLVLAEALSEGYPNLRQSLVAVEVLSEGYPSLRASLVTLDALFPVYPEEHMSTEKFPGSLGSGVNIPGIAFSFFKRPTFRTNKHSAASGSSVRNSLMEYPIWNFEATYEFLEDRTGADTSLKILMGFFCARQGAFDTFLFKDSDDYSVVDGELGDADGVTTTFSFKRKMGEFVEKIGQVDTDETVTIFLTIDEATTIPASPGPYTVTVTESASYVADAGVTKGGVPMTKVSGAPSTGEYAVNETTGEYTFSAVDESDAIVIRYRYEVDSADYIITMPNLLVFDSAPPDGATVTASFEFSFVCTFKEDMADFEKFMDKLWTLQSIEFESVPQ